MKKVIFTESLRTTIFSGLHSISSIHHHLENGLIIPRNPVWRGRGFSGHGNLGRRG